MDSAKSIEDYRQEDMEATAALPKAQRTKRRADALAFFGEDNAEYWDEVERLAGRRYSVKYQLSDQPVGRWHRTINAALRDLRSCEAAARRGGDQQAIYIVDDDGDVVDVDAMR